MRPGFSDQRRQKLLKNKVLIKKNQTNVATTGLIQIENKNPKLMEEVALCSASTAASETEPAVTCSRLGTLIPPLTSAFTDTLQPLCPRPANTNHSSFYQTGRAASPPRPSEGSACSAQGQVRTASCHRGEVCLSPYFFPLSSDVLADSLILLAAHHLC